MATSSLDFVISSHYLFDVATLNYFAVFGNNADLVCLCKKNWLWDVLVNIANVVERSIYYECHKKK